MESSICEVTCSVMPKSASILGSAGATMDDDTGDMNVKDETTRTAAHLRCVPMMEQSNVSQCLRDC